MGIKQIWVSPKDGDWVVHRPGNKRASAVVENKAEAIQIARDIAINNGLELIAQNLDGKISLKNSYGNDDCPPKN